MIAVLVLVGFAFGAQPLVGYNYGAKNFLRLKKILRFCYGFECSLAVVLACVLSLFAPSLISLFMQEEKIIELGIPMLRMQQAGMLFVAVVLVTTCTFQSAGKAWGAFFFVGEQTGRNFCRSDFYGIPCGGIYWGDLFSGDSRCPNGCASGCAVLERSLPGIGGRGFCP